MYAEVVARWSFDYESRQRYRIVLDIRHIQVDIEVNIAMS